MEAAAPAAAGTIQGDQQPPPASGQTDRQLASAGDKVMVLIN